MEKFADLVRKLEFFVLCLNLFIFLDLNRVATLSGRANVGQGEYLVQLIEKLVQASLKKPLA